MADKNTLIEQMLEHLVNDEQQKAEELFHEYVVSKSREIYEGLIESEISEEDDKDEEDEDEEVEENFDEVALEADPTDDLAGELDSEMNDDESDTDSDDMEEKSEEELFQDLDAIVDELQAKFDELKGDDNSDIDMDDEEMKDDFELETVREYVEKVPAGHGAEKKGQGEKADNTKSAVAGKNDMGGTSANIAKAQEAKEASKGTAGGLAGNKPQDMKTGNVNVPGGKAGSAFSTKEPGHGAEKKGTGESADNTASLFRGRR